MRQITNSNYSYNMCWFSFLFLLLSVSACSSGSNGSDNQSTNASTIQSDEVAQVDSSSANQLDDNAWLLGPYTYQAETSSQHLGDNNTMIVIASTLEQNDALGFYSGAGLIITMTDSGDGIYALADTDGVMSAANSGSAALSLNVNVGLNNTEPPVATRWSTLASTGTANVTQSANGRYYVSIIEPVTLTRDIDFGDGIPNSADQMQIVMKNINGEAL